jgi:hypothetical protein
LAGETGVLGENQRPAVCHSQTSPVIYLEKHNLIKFTHTSLKDTKKKLNFHKYFGVGQFMVGISLSVYPILL